MARTNPSANDFARAFKAADGERRRHLAGSYRAWVVQGARAQGWWSVGWGLAGVSAFVAFDGWIQGLRSPMLYVGGLLGVVVGVGFARIGARRERLWRRANPWAVPPEGD